MVAMGRALMSQPQAAADGRAVDGPRAGARRAQLRDHQAGERRGRRDARRGAERERVALDRRPRLRPLDRARRPRGQGRRPARGRGPAQGIPRPLDGRRQRSRSDPAPARLRARARDAARSARGRRTRSAMPATTCCCSRSPGAASSTAARSSRARPRSCSRARRRSLPPAPTDLARPDHARRRHRPPRADGPRDHIVAIERGRARPGNRQPLVPDPLRPAQRLAAARRCSSATSRPARRPGTTTSTTRSSGSGAARAATTSATRSSRSRTAPPSGSRRARSTSSRTRSPDARACGARHLHAGRRAASAAYLTPDVAADLRVRVGSPASAHVSAQGRRRGPGRVPDLRAQDLPQLLLAGRPLASRARRLRGVPRGLGRERRRVGVLGRARRGRPRGLRRLLHGEADEVAVTTSVSQGVSGIVSALAVRARRRATAS